MHHNQPTIDEREFDAEAQSVVTNIKNGDRGSLAAAITLVETEHKVKRLLAKKILEIILSDPCQKMSNSLRIGIVGSE